MMPSYLLLAVVLAHTVHGPIVELDFKDRNISSLESKVFDEYKSIKVLILDHNPLFHGVDDEAFEGLTIETLSLEYCRLEVIPSAISYLKHSLVKLTVRGNDIEDVHESLFWGMKIADLDLSYNDLYVLPTSLRHLAKTLVKLNLSENNLTSIKKLAFFGMRIETLLLQYNHLGQVPDELASLRHSLQVLDLNGNSDIVQVDNDAFQDMVLKELSLTLVRVERLPAAVHHLRNTLESLDLSQTIIDLYNGTLFAGLKLNKLYLDMNHLMSVPPCIYSVSRTLEVLSLGHNDLKSLDQDDFSGMNLTSLYVYGNQLASIPLALLNIRHSLQVLSMESNPLVNLDNLMPLLGLSSQLWYINLDSSVTEPDLLPNLASAICYNQANLSVDLHMAKVGVRRR